MIANLLDPWQTRLLPEPGHNLAFPGWPRSDQCQDLLVNRVGSTHDIASAISFLIGEDAAFISGQTLNVDGGPYMH